MQNIDPQAKREIAGRRSNSPASAINLRWNLPVANNSRETLNAASWPYNMQSEDDKNWEEPLLRLEPTNGSPSSGGARRR